MLMGSSIEKMTQKGFNGARKFGIRDGKYLRATQGRIFSGKGGQANMRSELKILVPKLIGKC